MRIKKQLNADSLLELIKSNFALIQDKRGDNKSIDLCDILMSAYAVFSLKYPSLLSFCDDDTAERHNLQAIFRIKEVPSDNEIRKCIDVVNSNDIQSIFPKILHRLQKSKELEKFRFLGHYYLISGDGTEYFKSKHIHCDNCMQRKLKNGTVEYYHQFYGAAIVHPDIKQVIPLASEPIIKQDGSSKNDCERSASKRWLSKFKKSHPKLDAIIIEDALASNAPHIKEIVKHQFHYILGAKESDHKYLFEFIDKKEQLDQVSNYTITQGTKTHIFKFLNGVPLNKANNDLLVNFVEYWEVDNKSNKTQHFSWVTDFELTKYNVFDIMRGGRARWKIENETFNTLKNQDYHFEHNFGHGKENLSVNFALLMMLAFLVDQTLEISCNLFNESLKKKKSRTKLWYAIRSLVDTHLFESMNQLLEAIAFGFKKNKIEILDSR